jgi:EthD domain
MWRVIMFLKRLSSVTPAEILSGWLELHAPALIRRIGELGSLKRASFNGAIEEQLDGWPSGFDGVLELWFDEFLPAAAALSLLKFNSAIRADAARWLDLDASPAWIGEANQVLDKPGVKARLFVAVQIADGWNEEDAQRYWREVHPVVAQGDIQFWGRLLRYTQIHGFRTPGVVDHMPIAAEIGAASFDDLNFAFGTEYYRMTVRPDEMKFVKPEGMLGLASCSEKVLYARGSADIGSTSSVAAVRMAAQ